MAAVFGGTQSLHTNSFDEAIALPTDFSARIARNTQLHHPGGDPHPQRDRPVGRLLPDGEAHAGHGRRGLGDHRGSRGDGRHDQGGRERLGEAADRGSARRRSRRASTAARTSSSASTSTGSTRRPRSRSARSTTPPCAKRRSKRLAEVRARRDAGAVAAALDALTEAARAGKGNLLDLAIKAMRARATVGEISDALEKVWGRYRARTAERVGRLRRGVRERRRVEGAAGATSTRFADGGGAPAAADGGEARPGRPRPRRQGDRHRVRRSRLRRRHRAAVPDAGGGRAPGDRERRARRSASRRSPPATRRWCRSSSRRCGRRARRTSWSSSAASFRRRTTSSCTPPAWPAVFGPGTRDHARRRRKCSPRSARRGRSGRRDAPRGMPRRRAADGARRRCR